MSDREDEIEARWLAAKPGPWRLDQSDRDETRHDVRHRGGGLVCERLDPKDAEAIARAPDDVSWLVKEVRRLRREVFRLGGDTQDGTIGKSRQGEITLATFKVQRPEDDDEEQG
jgi:hypothetical protein